MQRLYIFLTSLFGIHEVMFLTGLTAFFYGISGLFSVFVASAVSGALLMAVSIFSIVFSRGKNNQ